MPRKARSRVEVAPVGLDRPRRAPRGEQREERLELGVHGSGESRAARSRGLGRFAVRAVTTAPSPRHGLYERGWERS